MVARDVLEIGAFWSIAKKDIPSFERYMAQLKCYYLDFKWVYYIYTWYLEDCRLSWVCVY
jgi:hypothetical protein